jgi:hypothetical protein
VFGLAHGQDKASPGSMAGSLVATSQAWQHAKAGPGRGRLAVIPPGR